jgi:hypothetical protein
MPAVSVGPPRRWPAAHYDVARMGLLLTTIFSAALWITLISLGTKPFDALLLSAVIVLVAATVQAFSQFLPGSRRKSGSADSYTPR